MNYHYTNPQPTNSLGMYGIAEYGYSWGLDPVVYHGTLAQGTLVGQIVDDMPVYLGMNNISSSDSHAIALVGYSSYGDNMIIWNPWYCVTESYAFGSFNKPLSLIIPCHSQNPLLLSLFPINKGQLLRNFNAYSGIKLL